VVTTYYDGRICKRNRQPFCGIVVVEYLDKAVQFRGAVVTACWYPCTHPLGGNKLSLNVRGPAQLAALLVRTIIRSLFFSFPETGFHSVRPARSEIF